VALSSCANGALEAESVVAQGAVGGAVDDGGPMKSNASVALAWPRPADALQLSDPACEWERRELVELGETIVAHTPSLWPRFQTWMTALNRLSDEACKAFTPEAALSAFGSELRKLWLATATQSLSHKRRTAEAPQPRATRPDLRVAYSRDGDVAPNALERRCPALPAASEWTVDHVVFSGAQGALASVLYWAIGESFWSANDSPHLTFAGGNLDTQNLLDKFAPLGLTWGRMTEKPTGRTSRVILIEPAFCDEQANVMNIAAFHKTWRKTLAGEPTLIIIDTTLTGPLFPIGELLESLEGMSAPVVVNLRSAAELDQAGLELASVGIASIFRHKSTNEATSDYAARLRKARATVGAALANKDIAALKAPWFLNSEYFRRYTMAVFENNARLAEDMGGGGRLFASVLHPRFARAHCRWAQAPYTLLRLNEPIAGNYAYLERVIAYEAGRRGILLDNGKGFGARGHRFQAVVPDPARGAPFLRVAMGARSTPSLERAIRLLRDIAAFRDFAQLEAQYEGVLPRAA
jgi:hypothetical protein